ncbi:hypothetical protein Sa4125_25440 [Aureimonas sp. SA4125]|nr:hypothetical protein Sa4125_25440 [Aureimonas sp. SA4125]
MIRVTFDLLPGGDASRARTIGLMEIANIATRPDNTADYSVILKKCPPFAGALRAAWKKGRLTIATDGRIDGVMTGEDEELIAALVTGHHRQRRGVYDLFFRALAACGIDGRNPA